MLLMRLKGKQGTSRMFKVEAYIAQIVVASSYLTLGIFSASTARDLWWIYAIITLILSTINIFRDWRDERGREE